jgi:hypothetical protein
MKRVQIKLRFKICGKNNHFKIGMTPRSEAGRLLKFLSQERDSFKE